MFRRAAGGVAFISLGSPQDVAITAQNCLLFHRVSPDLLLCIIEAGSCDLCTVFDHSAIRTDADLLLSMSAVRRGTGLAASHDYVQQLTFIGPECAFLIKRPAGI
jgi:hypothetical protein